MSTGGHPAIHVIKNGSHHKAQEFDREKLHKSIVSACLGTGAPTGHAESIARRTVDEVMTWLESRPEVTSNDIRRVTARALKTYHPDASYLYEHHRSIV